MSAIKEYAQSMSDPAYWKTQAEEHLDWIEPFKTVCEGSLAEGHIRWFEGGTLNASTQCIDRHLAQRGQKVALLWESDEPGGASITYQQLHDEVCRFANLLRAYGVEKGDRVALYMPMIPMAVSAMLACARIGAIHSVVFAGFSAEALRDDTRCGVQGGDYR